DFHLVQRPEQIYRGGARRRQRFKIRLQQLLPVLRIFRQPVTGGDHHSVSCCDANRRCTTHHHVPDRIHHGTHIGVIQPHLLQWQQTLIQQPQVVVAPLDGTHGGKRGHRKNSRQGGGKA